MLETSVRRPPGYRARPQQRRGGWGKEKDVLEIRSEYQHARVVVTEIALAAQLGPVHGRATESRPETITIALEVRNHREWPRRARRAQAGYGEGMIRRMADASVATTSARLLAREGSAARLPSVQIWVQEGDRATTQNLQTSWMRGRILTDTPPREHSHPGYLIKLRAGFPARAQRPPISATVISSSQLDDSCRHRAVMTT